MLCNTCGTEHDRHCPCHNEQRLKQHIAQETKTFMADNSFLGPLVGGHDLRGLSQAVDPARAKFAKRCPRCGNDEWHLRRNGYSCAKCGLIQIVTPDEPLGITAEQLKKELAENRMSGEIMRIPVGGGGGPGGRYFHWAGDCNREVKAQGHSWLCPVHGECMSDEVHYVIPAEVDDKCPRCGNDEWHLRRNGYSCAKCGLIQIVMDKKDKLRPTPEAPGDRPIGLTTAEMKPSPFEHDIDPKNGRCVNCGLTKKEILIDRATCRPGVKPPDLAGYLKKRADEIFAEAEGVFCGTTGDKEHIKDKALGAPIDRLPPSGRCSRCSRELPTDPALRGDFVCATCATIEKLDAPLQTHAAWSTLPTVADPPKHYEPMRHFVKPANILPHS